MVKTLITVILNSPNLEDIQFATLCDVNKMMDIL